LNVTATILYIAHPSLNKVPDGTFPSMTNTVRIAEARWVWFHSYRQPQRSNILLDTRWTCSSRIGITNLFQNRDYERLADWLRIQRLTYDKQNKPVVSRLLDACAQLCEVLRLCSTDPDWYQLAADNLSGCEQELRDQLLLLLHTAAEINLPDVNVIQPQTWTWFNQTQLR